MQFIYKRDTKKIFTLSSREGSLAKEMIQRHHLTHDSVFYIRDDKAFIYSQAVLEVVKDLGGIYKFLYIFNIFPKAWGDFVYRLIAKHRYKFFGKSDTCLILDKKTGHIKYEKNKF